MSLRKSLTRPIFQLMRTAAHGVGKIPAFKRWIEKHSTAQTYEISTRHFTLKNCENWSQPLKLAVLSDFHYGAHNDDDERFTGIIQHVNDNKPDIILLLGDFVNTPHLGQDMIAPNGMADILAPLSAPLGVWAVLGNHDWKHGGKSVQKELERVNIRVLENEAHTIVFENHQFALAGIADDSKRTPDWDAALSNTPQEMPTIVMAHDPASFIEMPNTDAIMFSGHTHGGQIRLPKFGALVNSSRAPLKWSNGHIQKDQKQLYVTSGLGTSILPVRMNCPPEICFFTIGTDQEPSK